MDNKYPIGHIRGFKSNEKMSDKWHKTDGSLLSIKDFPKLFKLLGINFGGDGVDTFALPNFEDQVLNPSTMDALERQHIIQTFGIKIKD